VKFREQLGCLGMLCATLTACGMNDPQTGRADGSSQFNSTLSLQRRLSEIAGQANGAAPAEIDPDTRLDSARAGPGLRLTISYTLVNAESNGVGSAKFETQLTPTIKKASCANSDLRPLIDRGVVVLLEYRGKQGNPIGTVIINRETCSAPE
jgi:hypothetical protein